MFHPTPHVFLLFLPSCSLAQNINWPEKLICGIKWQFFMAHCALSQYHHNESKNVSLKQTYLKCLDVFHDVLVLQHVWYLHLFHFLKVTFNTIINTDKHFTIWPTMNATWHNMQPPVIGTISTYFSLNYSTTIISVNTIWNQQQLFNFFAPKVLDSWGLKYQEKNNTCLERWWCGLGNWKCVCKAGCIDKRWNKI